MKNVVLNKWLAIGASLVFCHPAGSQTVDEEMRQLARQLNLLVADQIARDQSGHLGPEFLIQFQTKSQLNRRNVKNYFTSHPTEVMAFRSYTQKLVDLGYIDVDHAESLIIVAFQSLEMASSNQVLANASVLDNSSTMPDPITAYTLTDSATQTVTLPDSALKSSSALMDFGTSNDQDQKASMAAQELEEKIEKEKRIERNTMLAKALIEEFSQGNPTPESLGRRVERVVTQFAETQSSQQAEALLDNVQVSITSIRNGPEYEARGLKAFDSINPNHFAFTEFGITSNDDDTTVNIGVGIRKLSPDQMMMGGVNAFYDQEIDTNHKRGSIGIELVSAPFRFNANRYYALTDGYQLTALQKEKPMSGHDVDVEVALPYLPGLFVGYNQSNWYGEDGVADVERKAYRLEGKLSQNVSVEVGKRTYSSHIDDQNTAKLSYNYIFGADAQNPKLLDIDTQPYRHRKIGSTERYRMVERENKIVTQVSQSGLQVTFTAL
ncbi:MAG: inverse autotransporter beta domain-containing protein [Luminiphilus sp.]|nr:inverse autotransporter beta domain-containing protein [Luminiphilus sp.]